MVRTIRSRQLFLPKTTSPVEPRHANMEPVGVVWDWSPAHSARIATPMAHPMVCDSNVSLIKLSTGPVWSLGAPLLWTLGARIGLIPWSLAAQTNI